MRLVAGTSRRDKPQGLVLSCAMTLKKCLRKFWRTLKQGCQNKPATGTFHRLFWILRRLLRMLVGQFWAWYWRNKMEIAAYYLDGTCYSKTYWQPSGLYIRVSSRWSLPASLPGFAGYSHCFMTQVMSRRWCLSGLNTLGSIKNCSAYFFWKNI